MEQQQESLNFEEMLQKLWRRARLVLVIFVIGSALGLLIAFGLPPVYSSTAKILVESQQIPQDLARSTVTASAAERLELIEQRLLTRKNLLEIASELNLFAGRADLTPTDRVEAMRAATSIEPITMSIDRSTQVAAFTITYRANAPGEAMAVANEFVTRVLEQNLQQRSVRATETNAFFKAQIDQLQKEIAEVESRISAFKKENEDRLPDAQGFRQEELLALQERRFEREKRRIELEEQKRLLTETLAQGGALSEKNLSPEERELEQLRRIAAQRRAILAESHPEVRALSARIAALESVIVPASATAEGDTTRSLAERRINRQIELTDNQLVLLAEQDEADQARQAKLEAAIEAAPAVELALSGLYRRYQDLQKQREVAVMKQAEAETGERLEVNRQAERFEVIEQAERPTEPDAPNRPMVAAGGIAGSLALGLALAFAAEMMNRSIYSPLELERRTGLRAVVTIPYISTKADLIRRRRRRILVVLAVVIGVPLVLGIVDRQVMPLPILAEKVMTNSGLDGFVRSVGQRFGG